MPDDTFVASQVHRTPPLWVRLRAVVESAVLSGKLPPLSGHKVLGRYLRPYSYWHAFLLDAIGSPFAGHPVPFGVVPLIKAAEVCALSHPNFPHARGWAWLRQVRAKQLYRDTWLSEQAKFTAYNADYTSFPQLLEQEDSQPIKTPWYLYSVTRLQSACGMTESQAWNTPVCEGQWLCIASLETAGQTIKLVTPDVRAALRAQGHAI